MKNRQTAKLILSIYDFIIFAVVYVVIFVFYKGAQYFGKTEFLMLTIAAMITVFGSRHFFRINSQIWRYGEVQSYLKIVFSDIAAFVVFFIFQLVMPFENMAFSKIIAFYSMNTLGALTIRMVYRYAYRVGSQNTIFGRILKYVLYAFSLGRVSVETLPDRRKTNVAIIGSESLGVGLADELINGADSIYEPKCFVGGKPDVVGRTISGLVVFSEKEATAEKLRQLEIEDVVFATANMNSSLKLELFEYYQKAGFGIKVFDSPTLELPGSKYQIRQFDIEDLLMRTQREIITESTREYYRGKTILITGGGGSIGSELCRQLAKMAPKQIVLIDVYENNAYELQQGLIFTYRGKVNISVEIASIRDKSALARCFEKYHPDICINAAAHKHVPLMENNCIEAIENNVFGCLNVIECCEEFGCNRFMMVSSDKAVNPTNVMGATKRVCEMIMQAYGTKGTVKCSATRFGNVLGSAGSVIPLFKRQIQAGGPVTVTDFRVIRYFMTIPEASQLVLTSGAMAENGELFVLDMGKPVKIYDLARNMITMSGINGIDIIETGLRPGEKLYEELLVKTDDLEITDNDLIFIEREAPVSMSELNEKIKILRDACDSNSDAAGRDALKAVVPTFMDADDVNEKTESVKSCADAVKAG